MEREGTAEGQLQLLEILELLLTHYTCTHYMVLKIKIVYILFYLINLDVLIIILITAIQQQCVLF